MKDFEFYKRIRTNNLRMDKNFSRLYNLYKKIPETEGCLDNISKEGGCGGWCCLYQSPQLLYSEFLNIWNNCLKKWDIEEIFDIIELSLKNYIRGTASKGCVFFDKETKMCKCHKSRPYNCRIYGITPDEEFNPRYKKMKEDFKSSIGVVIRPQCDKVKTCNGYKVSMKDTSDWWLELVEIEKLVGIKSKYINDEFGGSYRTPHDHVLLYTMTDEILRQLQAVRLSNNDTEKRIAIKQYMSWVRKEKKWEVKKNK